MGLKFNPLSGQFDLTGSGGGGASYIDGEVQNFSALPETVGTPPVDSAYLVREAEGTWLINRKPAGIYIRTANTGTRASDWTHAGAFPDVFNDANFLLYDNADSTKNLAFQLSGITTGTTRTLTAPDASGTIARTEDFAAPPAIGSTTPSSGAFTTLTANNGTITASAPVLDLSQTWNASGVNFTGLRLNITNTASGSSSLLADFQVGGSSRANLSTAGFLNVVPSGSNFGFAVSQGTALDVFGITTRNDGQVRWSSTTQWFGSVDLIVLRDAADTLAQRRTTNPQTFNIYNTFTSSTNHERGFLRWSSNVFQIGTEKGSGGTARALEIRTDNVARINVSATGGLGFFGAAAVAQPAAIADATDAATTQARLNDLLAAVRSLGLIAT